jgi:hypothetical protein
VRGAGDAATLRLTGAGAGAGAGSLTAGSSGIEATGTSWSCGFEAVSWLARARSRVRLVSCASASSLLLLSLHAVNAAAARRSATDALNCLCMSLTWYDDTRGAAVPVTAAPREGCC